MEIATATQGSDFTPPPAGSHRARCFRFVDLGTQLTEYQGEKKSQHKIMLSFELCDEMDEFDGQQQPFTVHQRFTWSMHEKGNLRPFLESWRGAGFTDTDLAPGGFDTRNLIGVPCLLNVIHETKNGRTYANIASVSPLPKAMKEDIPAMANTPCYIALTKDRFDQGAFDALSDRIKDAIKSSPEYIEMMGRPKEDFTREDLDDEIPF